MATSSTVILLSLLILTTVCVSHAMASREISSKNFMHEQWMAQHRRTYSDASEKARRFEIFKENMEIIESINAEEQGFKLAANQFADLTNEEFKTRNGFRAPNVESTSETIATLEAFKFENASDVPSHVDWRKEGAVTPIKDQGECGSCWAFSTIAAIEGIHKLKTGKLVSLSEQELVDCDNQDGNAGCDGGWMNDAFRFIIKNNGIATESEYPYKGKNGTCSIKKSSSYMATISGYGRVHAKNETALMKAVARQPVSVTVDAGSYAFQFYSSGVLKHHCGTDLDHAVTAVGYGETKEGIKYWLLKNSWGTTWGDQGYIRIKRGVDDKNGLCGIAMKAWYPIA